jgi:hypothetical protein
MKFRTYGTQIGFFYILQWVKTHRYRKYRMPKGIFQMLQLIFHIKKLQNEKRFNYFLGFYHYYCFV